tara:strand:+ start:11555 stop:11800 length:246 start_codon:yes stop_codon:yes gene_type:complete
MNRIDYTYGTVEVSVTFDHTPAEKRVIHPVDNAHPGCDEEVEICNVYSAETGEDLLDSLTPQDHADIESAIWEYIKGKRSL